MREYLSVSDASKLIASEVVETGFSKNWGGVDSNNLSIASDVEKKLTAFNIGLVDTRNGTWGKVHRGSRHFSGKVLLGAAKGAYNSLLSAIKR